MKMDRALLDISPDDAVDLNNKKRILRWDAKKRKFVKVSAYFPLNFFFFLETNVNNLSPFVCVFAVANAARDGGEPKARCQAYAYGDGYYFQEIGAAAR